MEVEELLRLLKEHKVRFVIIGATAFPVHGYSRATLDTDLFIEPTPANAKRTHTALQEFGYDMSDISVDDLLTKKVLIRQYIVETDIHPLHLHFWRRAWYVIAFSEAHGEVRTFRLSRFRSVQATERAFPLRRFSLRDHLDDAWGMTPEGRKYEIVVDFSPAIAPSVAEITWHRTQKVAFNGDGSCRMRFRVNGLQEIKWWVLSFGDQAVVRQPPELRAEIRQTALASAARHEGS